MLLISFSILLISHVLNENMLRLSKCFWIKSRILGWNLHFSIAVSIGSDISSEVLLVVMKVFSLIFNVETSFLKNTCNSLAIRSSSWNTWSFSTSLICAPEFPLFEKNGLTVFQNYLLSITKDGLILLKKISSLF